MLEETQIKNNPPNPTDLGQPVQQKPFYIPALDGLRFIAFLMVFVHHSRLLRDLHASRSGSFLQQVGYAVLQMGAFGVPIFFALSGFLISRLLYAEKEEYGSISFKRFYARRILRIWPLYYLALFLATLLHYKATRTVDTEALLGYIFFYGNWVVASRQAYFSILWSLGVEEQFYLVWPFVVSRITAQGGKTICGAVILVSFLWKIALVAANTQFALFWCGTISHLDSLACGALLGLYYDRLKPFEKGNKMAIGIIAACFIGMLVISFASPIVSRTQNPTYISAVGMTGLAGLSSLIIWILVTKPFRIRLFESALFVKLGRASYGMYLFHVLVLWAVGILIDHGMRRFGPIPKSIFEFVVGLLLTIAVSLFLYKNYELRFLRLKHKFERIPSKPD